jgi:DNA-binding NarL/FixJ family response regulator
MSRTRPIWIDYTSPQSAEYAHEIQCKSGLDVRLLMRLPASFLAMTDEKHKHGEPTPAEMVILGMLAAGVIHKEAALALKMTPRTFNLRVAALRAKFGVRSNEALMVRALRLGLVK